jgi:hypothetical protein
MTIDTDYTTDTITSTKGTLNIANNTTITGNVAATINISAQNLTVSGSINSAFIRTTHYLANSDYILSPSDSGTTIFFDNSGPTFVNVSPNPILSTNFRVVLTSVNTGLVTIRSSIPAVIIHPRIGTLNQLTGTYASASLICFSANNWILDGSIQ